MNDEDIQQIKFFENPPTDIENTGFEIIATDTVGLAGQDFVNNMRDRDIESIWNTTGSSDLATTILSFEFVGEKQVDHLCFLNINFKSFTLEYFNGVAYELLDTQTDFSNDYYQYIFPELTKISTVRLTITSTQVEDDQKKIGRIFFSRLLGQLNGWPIIKGDFDSDIQVTKTLSGKSHVVSNNAGFKYGIRIKVTSNQEDNTLIENLLFYQSQVGFFSQISGGSDSQFAVKLRGFSSNYILKVKPIKDYSPEYYKGLYMSGAVYSADFVEVI